MLFTQFIIVILQLPEHLVNVTCNRVIFFSNLLQTSAKKMFVGKFMGISM